MGAKTKLEFWLLPFQDKLSRSVDCCGDLAESCPALS